MGNVPRFRAGEKPISASRLVTLTRAGRRASTSGHSRRRVTAEKLLARTRAFRLNGQVRRTSSPRMSVEAMPLALSSG